MKFINQTGKPVKVRKGKKFNYKWITVRNNETIRLSKEQGYNYGLNKYSILKPKINKKQAETKKFEEDYTPDDLFYEELKKIKGIGSKTAKDIVHWGTREKLVEYIEEDQYLPFRDDIVNKLKKNFQNGK